MKLKHKIVLLPCIAILLLLVSVVILFWVHQMNIREEESIQNVFARLLGWVVVLGFVILVVTAVVAWELARKLSFPIIRLSSVAREIADGNLSEAISGVESLTVPKEQNSLYRPHDETEQLLHAIATMTENLNALVGQVQRAGIQVATSSSQLSATAKWQETTVKKQMDSMDRVRASVEEVSVIATDLAETMHQVASMSQEAADFASSGQTDLIRMREAMSRMETASRLISDRLEAINEKAETITGVVTTITKVSEQTNLLSLNAAIEAEKAGEYGRGFSVIAREIRRLADQTAVATLDIARMVQEMQSAVASGVMEMDKFVAEMRYGVEDVGKISTQLSKIIDQVQSLSPTFENVNVAMENQSDNARQITDETLHLGEDMTQTMEALQESYSAIEQLNEAAQNLQNEVSRFQVSSSILEEIEIFRPFSDDAKTYLQQRMQGRHYAPGSLIIRQGDLTNSLYIIAKGVVSIQVQLQNGESLEVARYAVGQILGEISLLTGEPRTADVLALSDCYLFEIHKEDIAPFIEAEPEIAERLSAILTERKLDTETKKNRYEAQHLDRDAEYARFLHKIQSFFGLKH